MSQTNNETIWMFYKFIIGLPDQEYNAICQCMRDNEPVPGMADKMICKANKKRKLIAEYDKNICL